jgi:MSHA pilin protein MshC
MVELIVVIVLIGILSAVGVSRFFDRSGFDAAGFTEQARSMLRYAQKVAIARNAPVFVRLDGTSIALCLDAACAPGQQVTAPSGANSGRSNTVARCNSTAWYCEGLPPDIAYAVAGTQDVLVFDALGRPSTANLDTRAFGGATLTITGDGAARMINVSPETGYVE